jgi:hypothetical protein
MHTSTPDFRLRTPRNQIEQIEAEALIEAVNSLPAGETLPVSVPVIVIDWDTHSIADHAFVSGSIATVIKMKNSPTVAVFTTGEVLELAFR